METFCSSFPLTGAFNSVITSFQLKVEELQGDGDDSTTNDNQIVCAQFDRALWITKAPDVTGWGYWGDWGEVQICPALMAVCGIRTQVHEVTEGNLNLKMNNFERLLR